jgi:hypothetical protein
MYKKRKLVGVILASVGWVVVEGGRGEEGSVKYILQSAKPEPRPLAHSIKH